MLMTRAARAAKVQFVEQIEESIDPGAETLCFPGRVSVGSFLVAQEAPAAAEVAIDPSLKGSRSAYARTRLAWLRTLFSYPVQGV